MPIPFATLGGVFLAGGAVATGAAKSPADADTSVPVPPVQVIDGTRALDRFIDVMREMAGNAKELDKNSTFFNTPKGRVGSLPGNYPLITGRLERQIAPDSLVYFLSDDNEGPFATTDEDGDVGFLCTFDVANNVYSILNMKLMEKIADTQDEERILRKYGGSPQEILGEGMQRLQQKMLQTFPELAEMFG